MSHRHAGAPRSRGGAICDSGTGPGRGAAPPTVRRYRWGPSACLSIFAAVGPVHGIHASPTPPPSARIASPRLLTGVEPGEHLCVFLVDHVALDLQGRRELAGRLREIVVEDHELLDLLDLGVFGVGMIDLALDQRANLRVLRQRGDVLRQAVLAREHGDLLLIERDQHDRVGPRVAVHHRLGDPATLLEVVLDVRGRQVLAAGGDDDVLLAPGDREVAVLVDRAEVARVQPSILDRAEALVRAVVVALEDLRAFDKDLSRLSDPQLDPRKRSADGAEAMVLERGDGRGRGGLGHAVSLEHGYAAGVKELEDLVGDGRCTAGGVAHVAAKDRAHVLEYLLVGLIEGALQLRRDRLAPGHHVAHLDAEPDRLLRTLLLL